jgi:glycosyltransferase involved in cell wall biosynthesis
MRIAFFHELHKGGARRASNEFAKIIKDVHSVDLYLVDEFSQENERQYYNNVNLFIFKPKLWTGKNWKNKLYKDTVELYKLYKLHQKIAEQINNKKYDLAFVQGSKYTQAPFILRFLRVRTIYYCQEPLRMVYEEALKINRNIGFFKYYYERINRLFRKIIDKSNIVHADLVLANSGYTKQNIFKAYGIVAKVCYMGVDVNVFNPQNVNKRYDVLFVGAYGYMDGYPLVNEIISKYHPEFKLAILASEKKWINNDREMGKLYSKSKIALALGINEPFGLIPLEAMACGVPVVAVNEGGYKETIISKKTGYLLPRDPRQIFETIKNLLSNKDQLKAMSINARKHVSDSWTWDKSAQKLLQIIKDFDK